MSPQAPPTHPATRSFPRVSGDEPHEALGPALGKLFSPRERG